MEFPEGLDNVMNFEEDMAPDVEAVEESPEQQEPAVEEPKTETVEQEEQPEEGSGSPEADFLAQYFSNEPAPDNAEKETAEPTEQPEGEEPLLEEGEEPEKKEDYFPPFIKEDYRRPEKFENEESELDFYRKAYDGVIKSYQGKEFTEHLKEQYSSHLAETEKDFNEFQAFRTAMQSNDPEMVIKAYLPNALIKGGHDPSIGEEQANEYMRNKIAEEFGEDWQNHYNKAEAEKPTSFSGKITARVHALRESIQSHNQQVAGGAEEHEKQRQELIDENYNKHFKGAMTREQFNEFTENAREQFSKMDLKDIYRVMNFDRYMKKAYERGINEQKQKMMKEIQKAGGRSLPPGLEYKSDNSDSESNKNGRELLDYYGNGMKPLF